MDYEDLDVDYEHHNAHYDNLDTNYYYHYADYEDLDVDYEHHNVQYFRLTLFLWGLRKKFSKSKHKEFGIRYTSKVRPE